MDKELEYRDRAVAWFLAPCGLFVGYSLIHGSHNLWSLPIVSKIIFPLGCLIVIFWFAVITGKLSYRAQEIGWWSSIAWHAGWLIYLILTIFGFLGMLKAAPLLLLWLILAGFLSVIAIHDLRQRIKDAEQDVHGNTH
jgi:hypothetical protein